MRVGLRHTEPANRLSLKIKLHQHGGLAAHDPPIVSRLNNHDLRSFELRGAAVRILDMHLAMRQETDVRVHAEIRAGDPFHVFGPAKSGGVDHTLYAAVAGPDNIELNAANLAVFGSADGCEEWISHKVLRLSTWDETPAG
jgi:hypothetical protein